MKLNKEINDNSELLRLNDCTAMKLIYYLVLNLLSQTYQQSIS